jgi:hypothetical protein
VVLVVANLGTSVLRGVSLSAAEGALPMGRWTLRSLIGTMPGAPIVVGASGKVDRYVPMRTLAPMQGYVFELQRR